MRLVEVLKPRALRARVVLVKRILEAEDMVGVVWRG